MIDLKKDCTPAELRAMADALEWANVRTRPQFDPKAKELRAQAERMEAKTMFAEVPFPKERRVRRNEDMSPRGYLELFREDDGDIIVTSCGMANGLVEPGSSVQFCALGGGGGGRSEHTRRALLDLMMAMEKDNAERPIQRADDSEGALTRETDSQESPGTEREVGPPDAQKPVAWLCEIETADAGKAKFFTAPSDPRAFAVYIAPPDQTARIKKLEGLLQDAILVCELLPRGARSGLSISLPTRIRAALAKGE